MSDIFVRRFAGTDTTSVVFFWIAIVGGLLLAVSWFFDPSGLIGAAGAALFLVGILWFLGLAYRAARREGLPFGRSLRRSASDALRLAWLLMP